MPETNLVRAPGCWLPCLLAFGAALLLRWPGLDGTLWLDELWSLQEFAMRAGGVLELCFGEGFRHDNNHLCNSIFLYLCGPDAEPATYRMLALCSSSLGVAAGVALCGMAGRSGGRAAGIGAPWLCTPWLGAALLSGNFLLVVYGSEARGYGPLLGAVLLASCCLRRALQQSPGSLGLPVYGYWACSLFGLLAHPSYVLFLLGAWLWNWGSCTRLAPDAGLPQRCTAWLRLQAVPLGACLAFYLLVLRGAVQGGGPPYELGRVGDEVLSWTLGYPTGLIPPGPVLVLLCALLGNELRLLRREGEPLWLLHLGVVFLAPAVVLLLLARDYLFARYFLIPAVFALLLLCSVLARLWRSHRLGPPACLLVLCAYGIGQGAHLRQFYRELRGEPAAAFAEILAQSPAGKASLSASPADAWLRMPLEFLRRRDPRLAGLRYVDQGALKAGTAPDWLLFLDPASTGSRPPRSLASAGRRYRLHKSFAKYGPSGMHWHLYRPAE